MNQVLDVSELSEREPEAHPNAWPLRDYDAFIAVYGRTLSLIGAFGAIADLKDPRVRDRLADAAVTEAVTSIGLPRDHWLRDSILAGCFGLFRQQADGRLRCANAFLRFLDRRDVAHWSERQITWARALDRRRNDH
ncbi:MAG: hypothetical protein AAGH41_09040 [Pseudomonadota bacterium]